MQFTTLLNMSQIMQYLSNKCLTRIPRIMDVCIGLKFKLIPDKVQDTRTPELISIVL